MRKHETQPFNRHFAIKRIKELNLKFAWIAAKISVNEKTISRWMNGQVNRIQFSNIEKLALVLECDSDDLIDKSSTESYGSPSDQILAANLIEKEALFYDLYPIGKIKLIGSIIQSTLQPNVPKVLYAKLLSQLAVIHWTQRKFDKGEECGLKAIKIAEEKGREDIINSASQWLALIHVFQGKMEKANSLLINVIDKLTNVVCEERAHAYHTMALLKFFLGQFEEGVSFAQQAIDVGQQMDLGINKEIVLSSAYSTKANLLLHLNKPEEAESSCIISLHIANQSRYDRQIHISRSFLAYILAYKGDVKLASQLAEKCIKDYQQTDVLNPTILSIGATVARLDDRLDDAIKHSEVAYNQSKNMPYCRELVRAERAMLLKRQGKIKESIIQQEQAISFYKQKSPIWESYIRSRYEGI